MPTETVPGRRPPQSSRTNVTIRLTWYSAIWLFLTSTRCSLTQALRTFRRVFVEREIPWWMASSKLFGEVELISVTRATAIWALLHMRESTLVRTPYRGRLAPFTRGSGHGRSLLPCPGTTVVPGYAGRHLRQAGTV